MSANVINHRKLTVHVTGYDGLPAKKPPHYKGPLPPFNPAGAIVQLLPSKLSADNALNTSGMDIELIGPGSKGLPPSYAGVREMLKNLHNIHGATIDLWVHLGASPWDFVTCERRAFRQDFTSSWLSAQEVTGGYYLFPDADDETARDIGPNPWTDIPIGLHSQVPIDETVQQANISLGEYHRSSDQKPLQVVTHIEAGSNACGFALYESMANCFVAGRKRDVLFVHVPIKTEREELEKARDATMAIIGAAILAILRRNAGPPKDLKDEFGDSR